jgi:hypothetical protein
MTKNPFSPENISNAIQRVPATHSKGLRTMLTTARKKNIADLIDAIEHELQIRGDLELNPEDAATHADWSEKVAKSNLTEAIFAAFSVVQPNVTETEMIRKISKKPGISHEELYKSMNGMHINLPIGNLVKSRFGFFRKFWDGIEFKSALLLDRDNASGQVCYSLTTEAKQSFRALQII